MKRLIVISLLLNVLLTVWAVSPLPQLPAALHRGDKVAIISPGSTPAADNPERAAATLREWGFEPVVGPHALSRWHFYAGTVEERCNDLLWALRDTTIKAVVCTRGGYGAAMLLGPVALDEFARHPKWVVGYSDITALHSAMVRAGVVSVHANMGGALGEYGPTDSINLMLRDVLMGRLPSYTVPSHPLNHQGRASGIVLGGNMAVFSSLSGSEQWDFLDRDYIKGKDIILFFEDVSESMPRVNTMLNELRLKGLLNQVKGIIVGRFTDYKPRDGYADMNEMLDDMLRDYNVPVCYDFPVSHDETWNYPVLEGCRATLVVAADGVTLTFEQ